MEMQEVLEDFSNEFKVVKMEVIKDCSNLPKEHEQEIMGDSQTFGEFVETFVASLMKPMVEKYLDKSRANELFQRLQKQAAKKSYLSTSMSYDMILAIIQRMWRLALNGCSTPSTFDNVGSWSPIIISKRCWIIMQ